MNGYLLKQFLAYRVKAKDAHAIHSPFVFSLYNDVFYNPYPFYAFQQLDSIRKVLESNKALIENIDFGAGSKINSGFKKKISDIARHGITRKKYAELLFRLVQHFDCQHVLELGTSLGLTSLYLAQANSKGEIYTLEGNPHLVGFAEKLFSSFQQKNIRLIEGNFNQTLENVLTQIPRIDFLFVDGNHRKESTLQYFELTLKKSHANSIFVFDDIHWSSGMNEAWEIIKKHPSVKLSIDIFQFGIIFFRKEHLHKENYLLKY